MIFEAVCHLEDNVANVIENVINTNIMLSNYTLMSKSRDIWPFPLSEESRLKNSFTKN